MENTDLIPYVFDDIPAEETPARRTPTITILLCAAALLFYGTIAAGYIKEHRKNERWIVRLLLGDLAGGIGNVYSLPDHDGSVPFICSPDESTGDTSLDRLERIRSDGGDSLEVTNNETPYDINMDEIMKMPRAVPKLSELYAEYGDGAPVVLIIHTHGTEAYADHADSDYRTDGKDGVIGIGTVIADTLKAEGVNVIHCEIPFDLPDFTMAYYSAALAIRDYLSEYPSISYVIDVHRDSIMLPDGSYFAPVTSVNGESAAKLMFVVGTDYAGSGHVGWRDNLALCARIQSDIGGSTRGMMRALNLRAASFNEQYTKGSMLLEVGSCANTYDEAARSAGIFAHALADEIKG